MNRFIFQLRKFSTQENQVLTEIKNNVFYCKINNPSSKNALSKEMIVGIQNSINKIQTNNDLHAAVFCSSFKGIFCSGANLKVFLKGKIGNESSRNSRPGFEFSGDFP